MNSTSDDKGGGGEVSPVLEEALLIARMVLGTGNIIIGIVLIIWLIYHKRLRSFASRLVLYISISDIIDELAWYFGNPEDATSLCYLQAIVQSFGDWSVILWSACIASLVTSLIWVIFQIVVWKLAGSRKQEIWFISISWGIPLLIAILPFISNVYGSTGEWCWIKSEYTWWRLGSLYIPLFIVIAIVTCLTIRSELKINKIARREAVGFYKRGERRLTGIFRIIIHRSRIFIAAFMFVWIFPLCRRLVFAMITPNKAWTNFFGIVGTAILPLWGILIILAWWLSEGDKSASKTERASALRLKCTEHQGFSESTNILPSIEPNESINETNNSSDAILSLARKDSALDQPLVIAGEHSQAILQSVTELSITETFTGSVTQ